MQFPMTFDELMTESLKSFEATTGQSPGLIARAILKAINRNIAGMYQTFDLNMAMLALSKAEGRFLDLWGAVLDCKRLENESDNNYRYRITQQVYVVAGTNESAIRLKLLQIPGVANIKIKRYVLGTGSFAVFVIPEADVDYDHIINLVQAELDESAALGIKAIAVKPTEIPVDVSVRIVYRDGVSEAAKYDIQTKARTRLRDYIENLDLGEELIVNEMRERVMSISEQVKDMTITRLSVAHKPVLLVNLECFWDERFVPNLIEVF